MKVEKTSEELQTKLGKEFMVDYIGDLQWKIKPTIQHIGIDFHFRLE